jgi:hypothetical protein
MRLSMPSGSPLWVAALIAVLLVSACSGGGAGLAIGDDAPGFSLPEASGSTVSLDDFSGTATLLYFHMADG